MKSNMVEFQAIILAAGKGSRMPELTADKPKCLLPIGSKPMVWYPLYNLQHFGFKEVIMIVCESQRSEIQATLDKTDLEIKIDYVSIPNNDEMGTADSIRSIHDRIKSDAIILSCDLITNFDLFEVINLYRKHDAAMCSVFFEPCNEQVIAPGPKTKHKIERDLVAIDTQTNRLVFLASASDFESVVSLPKALFRKHTSIKMHSNLIDSHIYIVKNWLVKYLNHEENISTLKGEFLPHVLRKQLMKVPKKVEASASVVNPKEATDIFGFISEDDLWKDIREASSYNDHTGDMKGCYQGDLIRCYGYIAKPDTIGVRVNTMPAYWSINGKIGQCWDKITQNKPLVPLDPSADVKSTQVDKCYVWDSAILKEKTSFKNSIVGSGSEINSFSRVFNSIIMNNVVVKEKVAIENCIVCNGAVIESQCNLNRCIVGSNHVVLENSVHSSEVLTESDQLMEF